MADAFLARLPSLGLGVIVFVLFYGASALVSRLILRATAERRHNVGVVFARLVGAGIILLGFLVSFSIVAPTFGAGDLIKVLGIGSVAIGFAFQNILQNFLAGLLLLWTEPFRVGDQIRLDTFEGTVEDVAARATTIKTYDGKRVVIPMRICLPARSRSTQPLNRDGGITKCRSRLRTQTSRVSRLASWTQ